MDRMNISITNHLAGYARAKVMSGRYDHAGEVVRYALRRMEDEDLRALVLGDFQVVNLRTKLSEGEIFELRAQIAAAESQIERGDLTEYLHGARDRKRAFRED